MDDESDDALAQTLFSGVVEVGEKDLPQRRYLDDEAEARMALVRLLIRPKASLSHSLRLQLAEHFHPSAKTHRLLTFKFRKKGGRPNFEAQVQIADDLIAELRKAGAIEPLSGRSPVPLSKVSTRELEQAIGTVADRYGYDDSTIEKVWRKTRPDQEHFFRPRQGGE